MIISTTPDVDPALPVLVRVLRARDLDADVRLLSVCGELDVRLVTRRADVGVVVELLASLAVEPLPDRWHAVRVRGEDRQVWQGPPHDAPPEEVAAFVEALLTCNGRVPYPHVG